MFIVDASMPQGQFNRARQFATSFAKRFDVDSGNTRIGALTYSSSARPEFYLNQFTKQNVVLAGIDGFQRTGGQSNTAAGLRLARTNFFSQKNGDRPLANNIAVLLTSKPSLDKWDTLDEAQRLRNEGVQLYPVGLGQRDTTELESIASQPGPDNTFNIRSPNDMQQTPGKLLDRIRQCELALLSFNFQYLKDGPFQNYVDKRSFDVYVGVLSFACDCCAFF